jgi:hypothetical protein
MTSSGVTSKSAPKQNGAFFSIVCGIRLRQTAADVRRLENVLINAAQIFPRERVGENAHRAVAKIERANVVETENVVNVAMRD